LTQPAKAFRIQGGDEARLEFNKLPSFRLIASVIDDNKGRGFFIPEKHLNDLH
jgi:hypothetical protein